MDLRTCALCPHELLENQVRVTAELENQSYVQHRACGVRMSSSIHTSPDSTLSICLPLSHLLHGQRNQMGLNTGVRCLHYLSPSSRIRYTSHHSSTISKSSQYPVFQARKPEPQSLTHTPPKPLQLALRSSFQTFVGSNNYLPLVIVSKATRRLRARPQYYIRRYSYDSHWAAN